MIDPPHCGYRGFATLDPLLRPALGRLRLRRSDPAWDPADHRHCCLERSGRHCSARVPRAFRTSVPPTARSRARRCRTCQSYWQDSNLRPSGYEPAGLGRTWALERRVNGTLIRVAWMLRGISGNGWKRYGFRSLPREGLTGRPDSKRPAERRAKCLIFLDVCLVAGAGFEPATFRL